MFTGIVEEVGFIEKINDKGLDKDFTVKSSMSFNIGDSVAVNGVCLTVREQVLQHFTVSAAYETLKLTNLSLLKQGDPVNLENSLTLSKPLGGHLVQGHVADTSIIIDKQSQGESIYFKFTKPEYLKNYIVKKGCIAVDGMSLTICDEQKDYFEVMLIPHTLAATIAQNYQIDSKVNLEVDIFARYIEKMHGGN